MTSTAYIYIWSLILEPLLYFVLPDNSGFGITLGLSRLLQLIVMLILSCKWLSNLSTLKNLRVTRGLYSNYWVYFALLIAAGYIGYLSGAYELNESDDYNSMLDSSWKWINSQSIRPIFEYFITIYYFFYFVILSPYILSNEKTIVYFLSVFKKVFIFSLAIGTIELALNYAHITLIYRHMFEDVRVGVRFHAFAGEPRDAFIYLILGIAMLHLFAFYKDKEFDKRWLIPVSIAALLTQSASGFIGVIFSLILIALYSMTNLKWLLRWSICIPIAFSLVYVAAMHSEHVVRYIKTSEGLWWMLENHRELPQEMHAQCVNIYPLYDLTVKFRQGDYLAPLIGSGLGSASVINNRYDSSNLLSNPHSQLVRSIFEAGFIGTALYILSLYKPIRRLTKYLPKRKQDEFRIIILFLIGAFLGQRNSACMLYVGVCIAVFQVIKKYKMGQEHPCLQ